VAKQQKARGQPQRSCVGCRTVRAKGDLIRVVRTPAGELVLDEGRGKLPGRGAYLCPNVDCLRRALKARALERALKQPVPPELVERLEALLAAAPTGEARGEERSP